MNENHLCPSCQQLMILSQDLFELAAYDAAYHTLVAALDCAQDREAVTALLEFGDSTGGQFDAHRPEHQPSAQRAFRRDQFSILKILARRARLEAEILPAKAAKFQPL